MKFSVRDIVTETPESSFLSEEIHEANINDVFEEILMEFKILVKMKSKTENRFIMIMCMFEYI